MYSKTEHLGKTREQLERVEHALSSLRKEVEPKNRRQFLVMAEGYVSEIAHLRETIDQLTGLRDVVENTSDLTVYLEGQGVGIGRTQVSAVTQYLEKLRSGFLALGGYMFAQNSSAATSGRPSKWLSKITDPTLDAIVPGSVGIHLSAPEDEDLCGNTSVSFQEIVQTLCKGIEWATRDEQVLLDEENDDTNLQYILLNTVSKLIPSHGSVVESVKFGGRMVHTTQPLRLTRNAAPRVKAALAQLSAAVQHTQEQGIMRELDLDKHSFILRSRPTSPESLICTYEEHLEQDVKELLDKLVIATGVLVTPLSSQKSSLKVDLLEEVTADEDLTIERQDESSFAAHEPR